MTTATLSPEAIEQMMAAPTRSVGVLHWLARIHFRKGSPDTVRVTYACDDGDAYPEWLLLEHEGAGRFRAEKWWAAHGGLEPAPETAAEAVERFAECSAPVSLTLMQNGKWHNVVGRTTASGQQTGPRVTPPIAPEAG